MIKGLVSIIIPSFNHEKYIYETLNSILSQTYRKIEIIITDDASSDNTVEIIKSFKDPRIKLFTFDKNRGVSAALNNSILESKGEFISVLGSDDVYEKDKLQKQVSVLKVNKKLGAVFSWADIIDDNSVNINNKSELYKLFQQKNNNRFEWLNYFFYHDNCLCASSAVVRRSCHDEIGYYDERFMQLQDLDLWIRLLSRFEINIIAEPLTRYRVSSKNTNISSEKPESIARLAWEKISILENYLDIKDSLDVMKIFPDKRNDLPAKNNIVPEFIICFNSLKSSNPVNKVFAISTLLRLFKDRQIANKIEKIHKFFYKDLSEAMGKNDMFNSTKYNEVLKENYLLKNKDYLLFFSNKIWFFSRKLIKYLRIWKNH